MTGIPAEERITRTRAFYAMSNAEGPLLGFFTDTYYPLKRYRTEAYLPAGRYGPADLVVSNFLEQYERLYREYEALGGELFWSASAFWGVPWLEAIAGCPVYADHETGSSRSRPPEQPPQVEDIPELRTGDPWVTKAREFLAALGELAGRHPEGQAPAANTAAAGLPAPGLAPAVAAAASPPPTPGNGRFPLATTLMRGIADLMAALYGSPQFVYRLLDDPSESERLAKRITALWIGFAESQLELIPPFHGGVGSFYYNLWMPGRGVWLQEDAAALLSPELFERFVLPGVSAIAEHFDSTIMHLHPSDFIPVEFLIGTELTAIELHIDYGGPRAEELVPYYRKIQSRKPLIIWGDLTREDLDVVARFLDPQALALIPVVKDGSEAEWIWRRFKEKGGAPWS
jgi:hypothetical protein